MAGSTALSSARTAVIGGGVAGLTTALELASRGVISTVFADRRQAAPTPASLVAPALFTPYTGPDQAAFRRRTKHAFARLSAIAEQFGSASGVTVGELREYCYTAPPTWPWLDALLHARPIRPVPEGLVEATATIRPHLDMLRYIPWLGSRARDAGISFVDRHVLSIDELFLEGFSTVFNCSGLGARALARDPALKPMHGQVLHVPNDIDLAYSLHDDAPGGLVAYIFTFQDRLVLGGTFDEGRKDAPPDEDSLAAILDRCRNLLRLDGHPRWRELGTSRLRALAAARPTRGPSGAYEHVRIEREDLPGGRVVVHHYGHGRAGASLTWGTAADAVDLVLGPTRA